MFPVPLKVDDSPFLPLGSQACSERSRRDRDDDDKDKKSALLKYIAGSERLAAVRPASRLEVRPRPEMLSIGIAEVDAIAGGLPRGCLTEICGPASSGKTSLLMAAIAAATRRAETCVLIDASDSFDPVSGAAAGLDFNKLLWIRCGEASSIVGRRSSAHLNNLQVNNQRLTTEDSRRVSGKDKSSERKLEQVLKTTDLILQSGGFGLVVLDLAGVPEKFARRIPLTSWFRFQRAVEPAKTVLLVVSESPRTQSCAALVIKLSSRNGCPILVSPLFGETGWGCSNPSEKPSHTQILESVRVQAEVVRSRLERRPMQSVTAVFKTQAVRAG